MDFVTQREVHKLLKKWICASKLESGAKALIFEVIIMRSLGEKIFESNKNNSLFSVLLLVFIVVFIFKESLIFFNRVSIVDFIIGRKWNPLEQQRFIHMAYNTRDCLCIYSSHSYSNAYRC